MLLLENSLINLQNKIIFENINKAQLFEIISVCLEKKNANLVLHTLEIIKIVLDLEDYFNNKVINLLNN